MTGAVSGRERVDRPAEGEDGARTRVRVVARQVTLQRGEVGEAQKGRSVNGAEVKEEGRGKRNIERN